MAGIATICWDFVPGSLSTQVEYRVTGDTAWITPTSPNNPTITNCYPLTIDSNVFYDVRLTTNGISCGARSTTFQIFLPQGACCPPGFTLSEDETYCYQTNTTAATAPSSPENTVAMQDTDYGKFGTLIYDPGYGIDGTGTVTMINPANTFWVNGAGYPSGTGSTTVDGPNNRTGLWATTTTTNQDVGFTICVNALTTGTYYIGSFADNYIIIDIDGVNIITMDPAAMRDFLNANGFPGQDLQVTFRWWHVYPVTLTAGLHVINVTGHNVSSIAAMGVEVYDMTSSQIQAANSYGSMGAGLLFSSKDFIGQPVQIGTGGFGYTCPSGYSLVLCSGPAFCTQTLITAPISCSTTTTTTTTSTTSSTTTTTTTGVTTPLQIDNNAVTPGASVTTATWSIGAISGISFPIAGGGLELGTIPNGTGTITVDVTGTAGSITVIDSLSTMQCQNYSGAGTYTFPTVVANGAVMVQVSIAETGDVC